MFEEKVKDKMLKDPKFGAEVTKFVNYMGWDLEEIENMSMQAWFQMLMVEVMEEIKDLTKTLTGKSNE